MRLQAQPPLRVMHAVVDCQLSVFLNGRTVQRLQEKILELHFLEQLRHRIGLREDELDLVPGRLH